MYYKNGLIGAMEEVDNVVPADDVAAAEVATTVADDSSVIQEENTGIETTVSQVEEAVQAGEELESIGEVAAEAVESGEGLTEQAAEVAEIAIESICNRLSYAPMVRIVPATESSFGNTASRLTSTKIVCENISETLEKIWASIKAAALRVWDMVKSFVAKLFNSTTLLSKHVDALRQRARDIDPSAKPVEKTLKTGVAKFFTIDKKANLKTWEALGGNLGFLVKGLDAISNGRRTIAEEASKLFAAEITKDSVAAYFKAQEDAGTKIKNIVNSLTQMSVTNIAAKGTSGKNVTANDKKKDSDKKIKEYTYGPFPGNIVLSMREVTSKINDKDCLTVTLSFKPSKGDAADEIEALNADGIKTVLETSAKLINLLKDYQKTVSNYEAMTKATVKSAETVISQAAKILDKTGSNSETRAAIEELKTDVRNNIADLGSFGAKAPSMVFQTIKNTADWASISMRNLKVK